MKTIYIYLVRLVLVFSICCRTIQCAYVIPDVIIDALKPKGLRVSLPDSAGVQLFVFNANVNQEIHGKEEGKISKEVTQKKNGFWTFTDKSVTLKVGDNIFYRVYVQKDRLGFDKIDQQFTIAELVTGDSAISTTDSDCPTSPTRINFGQTVCGKKLIFEDNFNNFDENKWLKEQYIAWAPDYEFVSYERHTANCFVSNGNLNLKPTLRENPEAAFLDLSNGCTGVNCTFEAIGTILPPIISARVRSRFSFKYGKIEIRAQLPQGDWIYPHLYLQPKSYEYGSDYTSGRLWIAFARGNSDLKTKDNEVIGNNVLYSGPVLNIREPGRSSMVKKIVDEPWGLEFHTYAIVWTPDDISVIVDDVSRGTLNPPYWSSAATKMAPFDKEFVVTLGAGVGGRADFPDQCYSQNKVKPWKNTNPRANLKMLDDKHNWFPTWNDLTSVLKIDYIKIWSL